jgi:AraC-like DNA-binding protein
VGEPWAVRYPAGDTAAFHVVTGGSCLLVADGAAPLALEAGDLVILPHGTAHLLRGRGPAVAVDIMELASRRVGMDAVRHGGDGEAASYLCGAFRFGRMGEHPLLAALPDVLHLSGATGATLPWLDSHLAAIACETRSGRPGAETVVARLSEILFVHAVRGYLAQLPEGARGWHAALAEPPIARALALMHRQPEQSWTVESLGRAVGMSRSVFAERFTATVGEPPLAYLAGWRMHRARAMLGEGRWRTARIARELGYASEAAFATAFKRWTGTTPGKYRRSVRGAGEDDVATAGARAGGEVLAGV